MSESNVLRPHLATRLPGPTHPHTGLIPRMRTGTELAPHRLEAHRVIHPAHADDRNLDLFRELRTRLLQASNVANPIILVSGVRFHCGASFVARNLAAAIALARRFDFMLFADECYSEIYSDAPPPGVLETALAADGSFANVAIFNSLS